MKKLIIISSILLLGCLDKPNQRLNLEGDLYFNGLNFGSFYGQSDNVYQNYVKLKDSLGIQELRIQDSAATAYIELLEKHDLVNSPFIYIKTDSDSTFIVFMSEEQYKPITGYTYQELIDNKQKVRLKLETEKLSNKLQLCKRVISIEKVEGETFQKQRKFKIEDYR